MIKKNNKGFTLAEMLIVVAIIGVLVAIVSVTISNVIEKAKEAKDMANIRSAYSKLVSYAVSNDPVELPFFEDTKTDTIKVFVKCSSTEGGWASQSKKTDKIKIAGISCVAPDKDNQYIRIRYIKSTGVCTFERYPNSKYGSSELVDNHIYNK